jgi:2-keto-4-pentenoate hydratase/2-oxohepta-3-ene-1,7-dioic acid hydratase in catechol pathway
LSPNLRRKASPGGTTWQDGAAMRLITFLHPGGDEPVGGEVRGDQAVAFDDGSTVLDRLRTGDRTPASGAAYPLADVTLLAPVPRPRAILAIGLNYRAHIDEGEVADEPPEKPIVFVKLPAASVPPTGPVRKPAVTEKLDYEGELAVVMGADHKVAGYAVANDVSARDLQRSEAQWVRGKGADTFCPWGPWITTADEVPDPENLRLRTWVNGDLRQDGSTADLIFKIDQLISFITETCSLEPGDLILTGTPAGVGVYMDPPGLLNPGDVVRIEIEGLGSIEHPVVA